MPQGNEWRGYSGRKCRKLPNKFFGNFCHFQIRYKSTTQINGTDNTQHTVINSSVDKVNQQLSTALDTCITILKNYFK
jgi:hypothetical protein